VPERIVTNNDCQKNDGHQWCLDVTELEIKQRHCLLHKVLDTVNLYVTKNGSEMALNVLELQLRNWIFINFCLLLLLTILYWKWSIASARTKGMGNYWMHFDIECTAQDFNLCFIHRESLSKAGITKKSWSRRGRNPIFSIDVSGWRTLKCRIFADGAGAVVVWCCRSWPTWNTIHTSHAQRRNMQRNSTAKDPGSSREVPTFLQN